MKNCPQCGTTYTDETLRFCLADGTALTGSEEPTLISGRREPMKVDFAQPTTPVFQAPATSPQVKNSYGVIVKILIAVVVLIILGILLVGGAGVLYFMSTSGGGPVAEQPKQPTTPSTPKKNIADEERAKLEKEVADLKKKLEEQNTNTPFGDDIPVSPDFQLQTATVNSPGDGFLALRNLPSTEIGERIAKIPHGETVEIMACNPTEETIGNRRGKWCLISWNDQAGWIFDAWLVY